MNFSAFQNILQVTLELAAVLFGAAFLWSNWRQGRNSYNDQAIATLKALVAGLEKENQLIKEENERLRTDMKEQAEKHAKLEGDMKIIQALAQGTPAIDGFAKRFDEVIIEFRQDIASFKHGQERIITLLTTKKLDELPVGALPLS